MPNASETSRILSDSTMDQYKDAAKHWDQYLIGDVKTRTRNYENFLVGLLREKGCQRVLDAACGTGVDSMMLIEAGFDVTSVDVSDQMLKYALKSRWQRRKDDRYDRWVIEEANWVTLYEDIEPLVKDGFDAIFCLGNSFTHLLTPEEHLEALLNFKRCLKPGGLLLVDHRNYDYLTKNKGKVANNRSIYYDWNDNIDVKISLVYSQGSPQVVLTEYFLNIPVKNGKNHNSSGKQEMVKSDFTIKSYPHKVADFTKLLKDTFGANNRHKIYGDFKTLEEVEVPSFYIHVIEKE